MVGEESLGYKSYNEYVSRGSVVAPAVEIEEIMSVTSAIPQAQPITQRGFHPAPSLAGECNPMVGRLRPLR